MRLSEGGIRHLSSRIEEDLSGRLTGLSKPQAAGLADLAACVLSCRSANTAEWQAVLPRTTGNAKSKERYVSRFLSNPGVNPDDVMAGFVPELLRMAGSNGKTVVLMMDQSKISDGFECLMVSLRVGDRAIPVAWRIKETDGAIGFDVQEPLLDAVFAMVPKDISIMLTADRFYGGSSLIGWCKRRQWKYRIRMKSNLVLRHEGGEITTGAAHKAGLSVLINAELNATGVSTNIGILHEPGHKEPWIIAMDDVPTKGTVLDYGMRWGIEPMFSDFKSRGFGITQTHLKHSERIERLILVLAVGLYWAVSTGMEIEPENQKATDKKKPEA